MAGGVGYRSGGILGLVRLLNEHGGAIEHELLTIGKHIDQLGTKRLSWRDLHIVVAHAAPGGALHRSIDPEGAGWTVDTYLLAGLFDVGNVANWQREGNKNKRQPAPVPRPGDKERKTKKQSLTARVLQAQEEARRGR